MNIPIDISNLKTWLSTKQLGEEEVSIDSDVSVRKVGWVEQDCKKWEGMNPTIEITYDEEHSYLLHAFIQIEKNSNLMNESVLRSKLMFEMKQAGVL